MRAAYQQVGRLLRYCGALRASQPREKHSEGPVPPSITVVRLRTIDVDGDPWRASILIGFRDYNVFILRDDFLVAIDTDFDDWHIPRSRRIP
jgi:hypothetical protein